MTEVYEEDLPKIPGVQAAVKHLKEKYPGFKIVVTDGVPDEDVPEELREMLDATLLETRRHCLKSLMYGRCLDCNEQMPGYVDYMEILSDDDCVPFAPSEGWQPVYDLDQSLMGWQCPACCPGPGGHLTMIDAKGGDRIVFNQQTGERIK